MTFKVKHTPTAINIAFIRYKTNVIGNVLNQKFTVICKQISEDGNFTDIWTGQL